MEQNMGFMPTMHGQMAVTPRRNPIMNSHHTCIAPWTRKLGLVSAAWLLCAGAAHAQLTGAGASSVRELMGSWSTQYGVQSGGVSYEAAGSSAGVARATDQSVDFGVSDVPLTGAALRQAGLRQVPLVGSAVVVMVNLPELGGKPIKLTGDILADIYQGAITTWNHSQIAGANAGLALPNKPIVPIWRTDGSGQSYVFSGYLARSNSKWRRAIASTNNLSLSVGKGVKGGQAMVDAVKTTPGAVGYDGLGAAQKAGLSMADLLNAGGKSIAPNAASVGAALDNAKWSAESSAADLDGAAGAAAYPMSAVAYALMPVVPKAGRKTALPFVQAAVAQGDAQARQAGFVPLSGAGKIVAAAVR
jgi:phosphate transport system substrate-binding protein